MLVTCNLLCVVEIIYTLVEVALSLFFFAAQATPPNVITMAPTNIVHLPNGQNLTVSPVFGGLFFKANDLLNSHSPFPPGWTVVLNSEDEVDPAQVEQDEKAEETGLPRHVHRYKRPTLTGDHLYISSVSNPSSNEFKAAASPTRHIAMMLWATLYWNFHQP